MIYVGTCGFAYRDWLGSFYPAGIASAEMLPFYARRFSAVEIDTSYYAVPPARTFASMAARTPRDFRFSVKAPASVTHPQSAALRVDDDARRLVAALAPLRECGKLVCVLAQFPNAFALSPSNETYLLRVVDAFDGVPVVVEFRRREWQRPQTFSLLRDAGAGYCNVDLPAHEHLLGPSSDATGPIGYVRFHGRNVRTWWKGTNVTRYDYEYTQAELTQWSDRIAEVEQQAATTLVFFNNHARGQAARNAEALSGILQRRYGDTAPRLVAQPPAHAGVPQQGSLFGSDS